MSKVMLVTGGSRGIGRAVALLAAARGYKVAINFRADEKAAAEVVGEIESEGGAARAFKADVSEGDEIAPLFESCEAAFGPVTALVNSAGTTGRISRFEEVEPEIVKRTIDLNVTGLMLATREAVRRMSSRFGGNGGGIVNISSGAATLGSSGEYVWYAGSKAAVDIFTQGLAREVAQDGIRINCVSPGLTETEIHAAGGNPNRAAEMAPAVPLGRAADPMEIAYPVLWLLSSEASYVTGAVLRVAGGR